jgi:two-component system, cell cycle sensor histidine kinase and response regulator CckA
MNPKPLTFASTRWMHQTREFGGREYLKWVRIGIVGVTFAYGSILAIGIANWIGGVGGRPISEAPPFVLSLVALVIHKHGHLRQAVGWMLGGIWLALHIGLLSSGSLRGYAALPVFFVVILCAGLVLGRPWPLWVAIASSVSAPLAVYLSAPLGLISAPIPGGLDNAGLAIFVVTLILSGVLIHFGLGTFGTILDRARASESHYEALFRNAPVGMILTSPRGEIQSLNKTAEDIMGASQNWVGRQLADIVPAAPAAQFGAELALLRTGTHTPQRLDLMRADGSIIHAGVTSHQMDWSDSIGGLIVVIRDVSERRAAEDRAVQLGRIIEQARSEIYLIGIEPLEFLTVSRGAQENLGYSAGELLYLPIPSVMPALTSTLAQEIIDRAQLDEDRFHSLVGVHRRADGSAYAIEARVQASMLGGRPVLTVFAVDITDRVQAEQEQDDLRNQLQHAQKMDAVGALAGGVAHDFNNLLTIIGGCAEMLHDDVEGDALELVVEIQSAQEKGATLTRKLLAFARKEVVQPTVLSISDAVRESLPLIDTLIGEQITLKATISATGNIMADPGQVEQILLNLAANAKDAMAEGGIIHVDVSHDPARPGFVRLSFSDDGSGIDEETLERVFDPFFTTKPRGKGTGLGLSTVHGIVVQNHGTVSIDSEIGRGTRIEIHWPITDLAQGESEVHFDTLRNGTVGGATILVVEDNEGARKIVRRYLERVGYVVITASHGRAALDALDRHGAKIQLLLTDVIMPGMSGLELAEAIRSARPELPVLFMSGYMDDVFSEHGFSNRTHNILLKPFSGRELIDRVSGTLAKTR